MFMTRSTNITAIRLTKIALITAVVVVLGFLPPIPLGFIPVPIVLQNLGVMLAGVILGAKDGTISILLLFLIGIILPAFSGANTQGVLVGPTAGYVIAWLFVPALIALCLAKLPKQSATFQFVVIWLFGVLFIDAFGAIYLAVYSHMPIFKSLLANLAFIPGDTLKAIITLIVANRLTKLK
ncbi:biotin transporter BioY [Ligilactobacillus agilis]|uniref:biotin transporter BioY n=1 Tax=Ligilactobacillus agilis TaxID=1601 RepID=UPI000B8D9456|nr:biotin biosynthesis protein BioY [Ligilactobacillus agilis]